MPLYALKNHIRICAVALATALFSCSGGGSEAEHPQLLIDSAPASSVLIMRANLDALLKKSGCDSEGGVITLTPDLTALLAADSSQLRLLQAAAAQGDWLDLSDVCAYSTNAQQPLMITLYRIESAQAGIDTLQRQTLPTLGPVAAVELMPGVSIVANDDQAWVACLQAEALAALADSLTAAAWAKPISAQVDPASIFDPDADISVVASFPAGKYNPFGQPFSHIAAKASFSDRMATFTVQALNGNSPAAPLSGLAPIDVAAFTDMPIGTAMAFAIGLGSGCSSKLAAALEELPMRYQVPLKILTEMLSPEGGTLALAAAPGGNAETIRNLSAQSWVMRLILPSGQKSEDVAEVINRYSPDDVYAEADSLITYVWNYDPFDMPATYRRSTDLEIEPPAQTLGAMYAAIPYRSEIMKAFRLRSGYDLDVLLTDSCATAKLRLRGPAAYLLPAMLRDAAAHTPQN